MDYTNGGTWRTAGPLPTSRYGLKAASIDGQLYVSKFSDMFLKYSKDIVCKVMLMNSTLSWNQVMGGNQNTEFATTNEILSWEPISETWTEFDLKLSTKRAYHAVAEVDLNTISNASCWSQIYPSNDNVWQWLWPQMTLWLQVLVRNNHRAITIGRVTQANDKGGLAEVSQSRQHRPNHLPTQIFKAFYTSKCNFPPIETQSEAEWGMYRKPFSPKWEPPRHSLGLFKAHFGCDRSWETAGEQEFWGKDTEQAIGQSSQVKSAPGRNDEAAANNNIRQLLRDAWVNQ